MRGWRQAQPGWRRCCARTHPPALQGSVPEPAAPVQAAFVLPQTFPVTVNTLNYAGVAVGIVMLAALLFWFLPFGLGARRWFRGEIKTAKIPFDSVCPTMHLHFLLCMLY